jgi:hypothetical protein
MEEKQLRLPRKGRRCCIGLCTLRQLYALATSLVAQEGCPQHFRRAAGQFTNPAAWFCVGTLSASGVVGLQAVGLSVFT